MESKLLTRPETVREFQAMFASIYSQINATYSNEDLTLKLFEEICACQELARKDQRFKIKTQLARVYSRLNSVATRAGIDLQEALWDKYPNICSYCFKDKNCICTIEHPIKLSKAEKELRLVPYRRDRKNEPTTLSAHQELHRRLYFSQNRRIEILNIAAHMAEEAGEVSKEFRHKNKVGLGDEISDVISWIFALANRIELTENVYGFELAGIVWELYPYRCERCHKDVCEGHKDQLIQAVA